LQSIIDRYPLYSGADEALYLLGQSYEGEIAVLRASKMQEAAKARVIEEFTKNASAAYSRIVSRYPVMERAEDAKHRLAALHQPIPTPSKAAIAQNEREEESRRSSGLFGKMMGNFSRHPDVAQATKTGEPTLVDPKPVSATEVVAAANRAVFNTGKAGENKVSVETVKGGEPPPNDPTPRSDAPPATDNGGNASSAPADSASGTTSVETVPPANATPAPSSDSSGNTGIGELKPNVAPESNPSQQPPPPSQVNEIQQAMPDQPEAKSDDTNGSSSADQAKQSDSKQVSSSKKKKKKHKLFF
jgi:outer membrane protein assembly factor BamD